MFTNFDYYHIARPEVFVMDSANPMMRQEGLFDAIVCDPPYGVRACTKKVGVRKGKEIK